MTFLEFGFLHRKSTLIVIILMQQSATLKCEQFDRNVKKGSFYDTSPVWSRAINAINSRGVSGLAERRAAALRGSRLVITRAARELVSKISVAT